MNLSEIARVMRRRWYVLLPMLLLAVAATGAVYRAVPAKYQASAAISLLASPQSVQGTAAQPGSKNPYMAYNSSLNDTADFLVRRLNSPEDAAQLQTRGVNDTYAAALAANAQGPFITLTVTGTDPRRVRASLAVLLDYTGKQLADIQVQADVPPSAMIGSAVIAAPGPAAAQHKSKVQAVLGVAILGLVLAFLAAFLAENLAPARRRHHARPALPDACAPTDPRAAPPAASVGPHRQPQEPAASTRRSEALAGPATSHD